MTVTLSADQTFCSNLNLKMSNFVNGDTTQTETATATMRNSSGTTQVTATLSFQYTSLTMSSVTLTPQSTTVDATAQLLVTFNVGTFSLTSDFNIIMTFPARFTSTESYFPNTITCANNTANINSTLSCSRTEDSSFTATVKVTNALGATIGSADSAGFMITNIKNPISATTVSGITMQIVSTTSDSYIIAEKSGITMSVSTAKTVDSMTYSFNSPSTIGVYSTANAYMQFDITPGVYINSGCRATLQFPTEITFQSITFVSGIVTGMTSTSSDTIASTTDSQCSSSNTESGVIQIFVTVQGPPQVKDTSNFQFTLTTSGGDAIASGTVVVSASDITTGTISSFSFAYVSGQSTLIQTSTEWTIGFTLANQLTNPWVITVTYPSSEFTISSCTPANGVGITTASTSCAVSGNTLTISGSYALSAGAKSFEGVTGTNPASVFTTGAFTMNSFNNISGTNYAVDVYNSSDTSFTGTFTATAQTLTSIAAAVNTPGTNSITGNENVTFDFTVVHNTEFPAGSIITLTIPSSN